MNITILNVTVETKPTAKGSYQVADVAYKNNSFQDKVEGKKVMSFGATAEAFKVLAIAQPGEKYSVNVVKNDKGYNDWVSMSKGVVEQAPATSTTSPGGFKSSATASPRNTYETPEERALKQVYIVRQSSVANAITLLLAGAKTPPAVDTVIATAKQFETYVFDKGTGFDDIPDLDPSFHNNEPNID